MRIGIPSLTVFAAVAFTVATLPSASAQTATVYPWCVLHNSTCSGDCSFITIEQCRATASGGVGFCYKNPAFAVACTRPECGNGTSTITAETIAISRPVRTRR
jgi:hypothetical protein